MVWFKLQEKPAVKLSRRRGRLPPWPWCFGSPKRYRRQHFRGSDGARYAHVIELEKAYKRRLARFSLGSANGSRATAAPRNDFWYRQDGTR